MWKAPSYVSKQMKSRGCRPNKPEERLRVLLDEIYPDSWKYVGYGQLIIGGKCPDFSNVNGRKQLIELYGDYWHREQNPQDRIDLFEQYGYSTLIIWENELVDKPKLVSRLKTFCEVSTEVKSDYK